VRLQQQSVSSFFTHAHFHYACCLGRWSIPNCLYIHWFLSFSFLRRVGHGCMFNSLTASLGHGPPCY
jgi:hypothetical protein